MENNTLVGYGSVRGNAKEHAQIIAGQINSKFAELNSFTVEQIKKQGTIIIICSTTGYGDFPRNCTKFAEELEESEEDLSNVNFAVCGFGSTDFDIFCEAGKVFYQLMKDHGAKEIIPLVTIDTALDDEGEADFEKFSNDLIAALNVKPQNAGIDALYKLTPIDDDSVRKEPICPVSFEFCDVLNNEKITAEGYVPDLNHITLKLKAGMSYNVCGNISILPRNRSEYVNSVIKALGLNENDVFQVTPVEKIETFIPEKVSVHEIFSQYLDLNAIPSRSLINAFIQVANEKGAKLLSEIVSSEDKLKEISIKYNIAEFICNFVKYGKPSLELLLTSCPHIQPRFYSNASSPLKNANELELTITNVQINKERNGLCTYYLTKMKPQKVALRIETGTIQIPEDASTPIIMACLGAGIAPMLSLMEHRSLLKEQKLGKAIIYFGARNKCGYGKVEKIFEDYKKRGVIDDYKIAYSRDTTKKVYITDLMKNDMNLLWNYWQDPNAHFFYCGPPRGIPEELKEIMNTVVEKNANVSNDKAKEINKSHPFFMEAF